MLSPERILELADRLPCPLLVDEAYADFADRNCLSLVAQNDKIMVSPREECAPPATVVGYVYVVITDSSAPISLSDDSTIVAGPALLFNRSHDEY